MDRNTARLRHTDKGVCSDKQVYGPSFERTGTTLELPWIRRTVVGAAIWCTWTSAMEARQGLPGGSTCAHSKFPL